MPCPTQDELRDLASRGELPEAIVEHVTNCRDCQMVLEDVCGDASILADLREAWQTRLDPRVRQRIVDICRAVPSALAHPPDQGADAGPN